MPTLKAEELHKLTAQIFEGVGASTENAETVARLLVQSNLVGHDSHGVIRIPQYLSFIGSGNLDPNASIEVLQEAPSVASVTGNWGFGQVAASQAMQLAISKASQYGVSIVTLKESNHVGRLSDYAIMATEHSCIGVMTVNNHGAGLNAAPLGGRERRLSTNPLCVAVPAEGDPLVLDITTSVVAEGKVRVLRNKGATLPEGWILDKQGNPSTEPTDLYDGGAILPFGGMSAHKGYGLSLVVDILSGALSRAGLSGEPNARLGNAAFMLAIHIPHFLPFGDFRKEVHGFLDFIKQTPLAPGYDEILIPGEPEARVRRQRTAQGIEIDDTTWDQIQGAARQAGVEI